MARRSLTHHDSHGVHPVYEDRDDGDDCRDICGGRVLMPSCPRIPVCRTPEPTTRQTGDRFRGSAGRRTLAAGPVRPGVAAAHRPLEPRGPGSNPGGGALGPSDLYRVDAAASKRPVTPGRVRSLTAALAARRTCPVCGRDAGYVLPTSLGVCLDCHDTTSSRPNIPTADAA